MLFWEDDNHVCPGTFAMLEGMLAKVATSEKFGVVKVGNGGSGIVYDYRWAADLVDYMKMHRGSENVDVQLWR